MKNENIGVSDKYQNSGNSQEKGERDQRIRDVALHGADLVPELTFNKPEKTIFGNIK